MAERVAKKAKTEAQPADPDKLIRECMTVLQGVMAMPNAEAFNTKVDWKRLGLTDYPKVIKHPMDLGTVRDKLKAGRYATTADFAADVRLVWKNAKTYNQEGSEIYLAAEELEKEFDQRFTRVPRGPLRASDALAKAKDIVKAIRKLPNAELFLEPVDWEGLQLFDYLDVIKEPMDTGTVLRRLEAGDHYTSVEQVLADLDLTWRNAMCYNQEDSYVHEQAAKLKKFTDKKFADLMRESGHAASPDAALPREVTFEMKQELVMNANEMTSKELYGLVYVITQNCHGAIDTSHEDEVQIDIDFLDADTFALVDRYVKDVLERRKGRGRS